MAPVTPTATDMTTMTTTNTPTTKAIAADFNAIQNRVVVALAKRERLIKSWTASSSDSRHPVKTKDEIDAEDADLFNPTPAGLGLGAPIPKEFLDGNLNRKQITSNNKLRHIFLGNREGLQASKPRDGKEKAGTAKRGLNEDSSDDDQGRSSLGKAKKSKNGAVANIMNTEVHIDPKQDVKSISQETFQEPSRTYHSQVNSPAIPSQKVPLSLEKRSSQNAKVKVPGKTKPLVDYDSEVESDRDRKEFTSTSTSTEKPNLSQVSNIFSSYAKAGLELAQNDGKHTRTATTPKSDPTVLQTAKGIITKQEINEPVKSLLLNGAAPSKKPSSKSAFSYSSIGRASTTESDPSDMETAIPLALASEALGQTSFAVGDSIISTIEAKRAKNRQKRQRKREKEQQRKAMESRAASSAVENSLTAVTGGAVVTKKIKDRLLDADGK